MTKKIILWSFSIIFFVASALIIGWIVNEEIGNGEQVRNVKNDVADKEKISVLESENNSGNLESIGDNNNEDVTIDNKNDVIKALEELDLIVNLVGSENEIE